MAQVRLEVLSIRSTRKNPAGQQHLHRDLPHSNHEQPHQIRMTEDRAPIRMFLEGIIE